MNDIKKQLQTALVTVIRMFSNSADWSRQSDFLKCPHCIIMPEHYNKDGSCRCGDITHKVMIEWGYEWDGTSWIGPSSD